MELFNTYASSLIGAYRHGGTEHSGRTALENMLNGLKGEDITVQHEPKRQADKGSPDFKVSRGARIVGYVENKTPGENLDKILKSPQIKKYQELSDNLILTDYLQWIWLRNGKVAGREILAHASDLETPRFTPAPEKCQAVADLLANFFSVDAEPVAHVDVLAEALAVRARQLRDALTTELVHQQEHKTGGKLAGLYGVFKDQVFQALTIKEFADAFAQTLAYALFLAKLNAGESRTVDLHNVKGFIPTSFSLIRELSDFLDELEAPDYADIKWLIDEILSLINGLDLAAIHESLSFQNRKVRRGIKARDEEEARLFERDPYVYFYEDFLARYDPKERETRGVYYTPPPVVNFIVRAIDDILKENFNIARGLADHERVTVLDFACGTGTFLIEVLEQIFDNIGGAHSGVADKYVRDHVLKHIYGFEFLLAPYTIAHLKLSQYLADKGHALKGNERLAVYLTNTLEPIEPQRNMLLPELSDEVEQAQKVKDQPILVITGNPPYSGHSKNKGPWIEALIDTYKLVDGKPLGEKNPKWLNDDYVKFIRFAQDKMDKVDEGVVGIITNHSFLDNPTFRGMRQSLMTSFDEIYVLDLHGNTKKREVAPDGSADMNVFDIQQGVAISLFVKSKKVDTKAVYHADLWGKRLEKYKACAEDSLTGIDWQQLDPVTPFYLFIPQDRDLWGEYEKGWKVTDVFPVNSVGIVTARDRLAIQFTKDRMREVVHDFAGLDTEAAREKYRLGNDVRDWKVEWAQADLTDSGLDAEKIVPVSYRPFDNRFTYFTGKSRGFICMPRGKVMRHMLRDNVGLLTARSNKSQDMDHFFVSNSISETKCAEATTQSAAFPLYLYPKDETAPRTENLSKPFRDWLDEKYGHHYDPEDIMGYIYAVLHSPAYRQRYAEFLRIDFPRVPFPDKAQDFEALAALGSRLIDIHLLHERPATELAKPVGHGDYEVEKPVWVAEGEKLYINKDQYFAPVPQQVWDFHIGGYQVLDKYLKSRKGHTLSLDEITHITAITEALAATIAQMAEIDTVYRATFSQ